MSQVKDYIYKLSQDWRVSGIKEGDMLLLHSNIIRTIHNARRKGIKITADNILDSFLLAIGSSGTLLLPLFNFDFTETKFFDINKTPSQMGALTEAARNRVGIIRTGHPIYSFAVMGYQKKEFSSLNNISGYGKDSPFGLLHKHNGKIASLDLDDQGCMTFYHYVEESLAVDYRYFKNFKGKYIDSNGKESLRTYKLYVRDLKKNVVTSVNPVGKMLWKKFIQGVSSK